MSTSGSRENSAPDSRPTVTVWDITDPTAAREGIEVLDQDVVQLESQPLRVRRVLVHLDGLVVVFHKANRRLRTLTRLQWPMVAFTTLGPEASATIDGVEIGSDRLIVSEPGAQAELVVEAGYQSVLVLVAPDDLVHHMEIRGRSSRYSAPRGYELRHPSEVGTRPLFDLGKRLTDEAARHPELFDEPCVRAAAHTEIMESLLASLGPADGHSPASRRDRTRRGHGRIIKEATAHALERLGDRIYVTDLCKVTNVSERTLQYAFQEILGLTPMAYLTRLRLHRVREDLRHAASRSTTVTEVATRWGFWHFGEFSGAYRRCFGERPSDTLRNQTMPTPR